jgi:SAM-dependent methyltransferase
MPDIDLYEQTPELYLEYQNSRPDYVPGIDRTVALAAEHAPTGRKPVVVDFCSGPGANSRDYAALVGGVERTVLIDINGDFLGQAGDLGIDTEHLETIHASVLDAEPTTAADVIIATFSYHHMPDPDKARYVDRAKQWLKPSGIVALGEIYLEGETQNLEYYARLFDAIPEGKRSEGLKKFLDQTARSNDFEFKVSRAKAEQEWSRLFEKVTEEQIWPHDPSVMPGAGTFVQIFRPLS